MTTTHLLKNNFIKKPLTDIFKFDPKTGEHATAVYNPNGTFANTGANKQWDSSRQ